MSTLMVVARLHPLKQRQIVRRDIAVKMVVYMSTQVVERPQELKPLGRMSRMFLLVVNVALHISANAFNTAQKTPSLFSLIFQLHHPRFTPLQLQTHLNEQGFNRDARNA